MSSAASRHPSHLTAPGATAICPPGPSSPTRTRRLRVVAFLLVAVVAAIAALGELHAGPSGPVALPVVQSAQTLGGLDVGARSANSSAAATRAEVARTRRLFLVCRSHAGAARDFDDLLWPSLLTFADWRTTSFTLVLDGDADADRAWGAALAAGPFFGYPAAVAFAPPPPPEVLAHRPFAGHAHTTAVNSRYAGAGYTRQLWDTLWLDTWLPPGLAADDVVGIVDTDAPLVAFVVTAAVTDAAGRLRIPALNASRNFPGDVDLLRGRGPLPGGAVLDVMGTNLMPHFLFGNTFASTRSELSARHGCALPAAWAAAVRARRAAGGSYGFSPVNVLYGVAFALDGARYVPVLPGPRARGGGPAVALWGANRPGPPRWAVHRGCCRAFRNATACPPAAMGPEMPPYEARDFAAWDAGERAAAAAAADAATALVVAAMSRAELTTRWAACRQLERAVRASARQREKGALPLPPAAPAPVQRPAAPTAAAPTG